MTRCFATLAVLAALAATATAQGLLFDITEVVPDPAAGEDQIVEITNATDTTQNAAGWNICIQLTYFAIPGPSLMLDPGESVKVHVGVGGQNTSSDVFTGVNFPSLSAADDSVSLYIPGSGLFFFTNANNIRDFVQWGAGNQPRANVATNAGIWPAIGVFTPVPGTGESLAHDGDGDTPDDWFRDASPTPCEPNLTPTANNVIVGTGCATVGAPPQLLPGSVPALGNQDSTLELVGATPNEPWQLSLGLGTTTIALPNGCEFHVDTVILGIPFPSTGPTGDVSLPAVFPDDPSLIGVEVAFQALVDNGPEPGSFNLTNGLGIIH